MAKGKKKNNDLILGIAIGAAATYVLLSGRTCPTQPPGRVVVVPSRIPAQQSPPVVSVRQMPRAARMADFFRMRPRGYGTLGVYHSI